MWVYIYDIKTKKIFGHEAFQVQRTGASRYVRYTGNGSVKYTYVPLKEGQVDIYLSRGRKFVCWLEEQDDDRARDILCGARLERVALRLKTVADQLAALEVERDSLVDRSVEVVS